MAFGVGEVAQHAFRLEGLEFFFREVHCHLARFDPHLLLELRHNREVGLSVELLVEDVEIFSDESNAAKTEGAV
jgi:hypothetical protein